MPDLSNRRTLTPEGYVIDSARFTLGLSTRDAATIAGMSESRYRAIVCGSRATPKPETYARLALALSVDPERFGEINPAVRDAMYRMRRQQLFADPARMLNHLAAIRNMLGKKLFKEFCDELTRDDDVPAVPVGVS